MPEGLRISVTPSGGAPDVLGRLAKMAARPRTAATAAAEYLVAQTIRRFNEAGDPEGPWASLSRMTLFIRKRRANAPRDSAMPGSDTGQLKGSFFPILENDGQSFGASSNLDYAERFNEGGESEPNTVAIGRFTRQPPKSLKYVGGRGKYRVRRSGSVSVRAYLLHMQSHHVEARPFYPDGMAGLKGWGYLSKLQEIFKLKFDAAITGGLA